MDQDVFKTKLQEMLVQVRELWCSSPDMAFVSPRLNREGGIILQRRVTCIFQTYKQGEYR